ncbi:MAG: leucyl aminopeptidase, partial [Burkholderiaceae bacterium]|nr:leucyl aminopeptidase [Burkholderiaceae bacterium]
MFTADDALAAALHEAGERTRDLCWRMPLDDAYGKSLKSNFADIPNIGGGRAGGSITAAKFLEKFTDAFKWAHLDIAGSAWDSGAAKGATGRPVPLLVHHVLSAGSSVSKRN